MLQIRRGNSDNNSEMVFNIHKSVCSVLMRGQSICFYGKIISRIIIKNILTGVFVTRLLDSSIILVLEAFIFGLGKFVQFRDSA